MPTSATSFTSSAATQPSMEELAEFVHHAVTPAVPALLSVSLGGDGDHRLGLWPGVAAAPHPADPLVGFVAPDDWDVIGLAASGRTRPLPGGQPGVATGLGAVRVTALLRRDGAWASVLDDGDGFVRHLGDAPEGWVPDALRRSLRHRTPPPTEPPGAWLEAIWVDRLAALVLPAPDQHRSWAELADLHPVAGGEGVVPPGELARRTLAFSVTRTWSGLRQRLGADYHADGVVNPPDAKEILDAGNWFDDGSFSRWVQRDLVDPSVLLPDMLSVLQPSLTQRVTEALTTVT